MHSDKDQEPSKEICAAADENAPSLTRAEMKAKFKAKIADLAAKKPLNFSSLNQSRSVVDLTSYDDKKPKQLKLEEWLSNTFSTRSAKKKEREQKIFNVGVILCESSSSSIQSRLESSETASSNPKFKKAEIVFKEEVDEVFVGSHNAGFKKRSEAQKNLLTQIQSKRREKQDERIKQYKATYGDEVDDEPEEIEEDCSSSSGESEPEEEDDVIIIDAFQRKNSFIADEAEEDENESIDDKDPEQCEDIYRRRQADLSTNAFDTSSSNSVHLSPLKAPPLEQAETLPLNTTSDIFKIPQSQSLAQQSQDNDLPSITNLQSQLDGMSSKAADVIKLGQVISFKHPDTSSFKITDLIPSGDSKDETDDEELNSGGALSRKNPFLDDDSISSSASDDSRSSECKSDGTDSERTMAREQSDTSSTTKKFAIDEKMQNEQQTDEKNAPSEIEDYDEIDEEQRPDRASDDEEMIVREIYAANQSRTESFSVAKRKKFNEYFDEEAELSGSDFGSADEDEDDENDNYEAENGDFDKLPSVDELNHQNAEIYHKLTLKEDKLELEHLKDKYIYEGGDKIDAHKLSWRFAIQPDDDDDEQVNDLLKEDESTAAKIDEDDLAHEQTENHRLTLIKQRFDDMKKRGETSNDDKSSECQQSDSLTNNSLFQIGRQAMSVGKKATNLIKTTVTSFGKSVSDAIQSTSTDLHDISPSNYFYTSTDANMAWPFQMSINRGESLLHRADELDGLIRQGAQKTIDTHKSLFHPIEDSKSRGSSNIDPPTKRPRIINFNDDSNSLFAHLN